MIPTKSKTRLLSAALALTGALGIAPQANALVVSGSWDPAFGASFSGLGFNGSASWDVPDVCLSKTGTFSGTSDAQCQFGLPGDPDNIHMLSATVNFYDLGTNAALGSLSWGLGQFGNDVTSMSFAGGLVVGLQTGRFDFQHGPSALDPSPGYWNLWTLKFENLGSGFVQARLGFKTCEVEVEYEDGEFEVEVEECSRVRWNDATQFPAAVQGEFFTAAIPEPQTYALMLAGLAAIGFVARRRRQP